MKKCPFCEDDPTCNICLGSGAITEEHAQRIADGIEMRNARIERNESLVQAANRLGISCVLLNEIEMGRIR